MEYKRYKHDAPYSYTLGMAPTIELIQNRPEVVEKVFVHPDYVQRDEAFNIFEVCAKAGVSCEINKKVFDRLSSKENVFVIGVFSKFQNPVSHQKPHVVLVNPGNSGNLGTIIRTGVGFDFSDLVIIRPGVDLFDPKSVRSSMGALFHIRFSLFDSFEEYMERFPGHKIYSFMLNGTNTLDRIGGKPEGPFSLVFGNEATGLPDRFLDYGESVFIRHNNAIDSLNLSIAFGIAAHTFSR